MDSVPTRKSDCSSYLRSSFLMEGFAPPLFALSCLHYRVSRLMFAVAQACNLQIMFSLLMAMALKTSLPQPGTAEGLFFGARTCLQRCSGACKFAQPHARAFVLSIVTIAHTVLAVLKFYFLFEFVTGRVRALRGRTCVCVAQNCC